MKPSTIERLVRSTSTSYPEIIRRATLKKNGGWQVISDRTETDPENALDFRVVRMANLDGYFWEVAYWVKEPTASLWNEYGFPKGR